MTKPLALIIEDDPSLSKIFSIALENDYEIELATDGNEALTRLAQLTPIVIILDLHLPEISGNEILDKIRADERLADTRVIIATADARQAETLSYSADLVLLKPISPVQLRTLAARLRPNE